MTEAKPSESFWAKTVHTVKALIAEADKPTTAVESTNDGPSWIKYVAMLTGVLAAVTGVIAVRATRLTNDAIYDSSLAVLAQAQASDAWAEYQAESIKARILEAEAVTATSMSKDARAKLQADAKALRERQPALKEAAASRTTDRDARLAQGEQRLGEKDLLEYAAMAAQMGIALASVAAITRRRSVFTLGIVTGLVSFGLFAYTFIAHYLLPHVSL